MPRRYTPKASPATAWASERLVAACYRLAVLLTGHPKAAQRLDALPS
jgi:hypothetical protein